MEIENYDDKKPEQQSLVPILNENEVWSDGQTDRWTHRKMANIVCKLAKIS